MEYIELSLKNLPTPQEASAKWGTQTIEIPVKQNNLKTLLSALQEKEWLWNIGTKPSELIPPWENGFIHLFNCTFLTQFASHFVGAQITMNITDFTASQNNCVYCSCPKPQIKKVCAGISSGATVFDFCQGCKKEVK
jgi:hypothetical protein